MERLFSNEPVAIETRDDGGRRLVGYGAVFYRADDPGTEYELGRDIFERVSRSAFDKSLGDGEDVRGLFNHSADYVLGRVSAGTMRLRVDDRGLRYEIDLPDTQYAADLATSIARGDITGSSFAFKVIKDGERRSYDNQRRATIRHLDSVSLRDIGPVTFPAYRGTTAGMRSEVNTAADIEALEQWHRERSEEAERIRVRMRMISLDTELRGA